MEWKRYPDELPAYFNALPKSDRKGLRHLGRSVKSEK